MGARVVMTGTGGTAAAAALVLAGLAGGALGPSLAAIGPWAPAAGLALLLALAGWLARGAPGALAPRAAVALGGGALAGLLLEAPAGLAHALFGLALGLALPGPGRGEEDGPALLEALPVAAGALAGGALAGAVAPAVLQAAGGLGPEAAGALVAGALTLGVAAGDAARRLVVLRAAPPAWVADVAAACEREAPAAHAALAQAVAAHGAAVAALGEAGLDRRAARDAGLVARDLLAAAARAADDARRMTGAAATLVAGPAAPGEELAQARARIGASLDARREAALADAARHAAALARLAASLVARGAGAGEGGLERRADALARRVEVGP